MLGLSQATYSDNILARFSIQDSKKGFLPFKHRITLSRDQCPKIPDEIEKMKVVPYASVVGSLMYGIQIQIFMLDRDSRKSTLGYAFTLGGGAIS